VPSSMREKVAQLVTESKNSSTGEREAAPEHADSGSQPLEIDFGSDIPETPIIAGVIFSRNAIRVGEGAAEAGVRDIRLWMEEVAKQQFQSPEERLRAIGEAVQAATGGSKDIPQITPDQAAAILDEMGVTADQVQTAKEKEAASPKQAQAMLAELEAQIMKLQGGDLPPEQFQEAVTELKDKGVPKDQIAKLLEEHGIGVRSEDEVAVNQNEQLMDKNATESSEFKKTTWSLISENLIALQYTDPEVQSLIRDNLGAPEGKFVFRMMSAKEFEEAQKNGIIGKSTSSDQIEAGVTWWGDEMMDSLNQRRNVQYNPETGCQAPLL